jgi:drug/metabolite transporter (DMT)-like permease
MKNNKLHLMMSLAMFSWAIAWTNAKIVNEYLSFYNLIFLRFSIGFVSLYPFIMKKNNLKVLTVKNMKYLIPASIFFFIYNISFFMGTHYGYAGKGAVLVTTLNPIITFIIMSIIYRKINRKDILGVFIGLLGGFIIIDIYNEGFYNIFNQNNIFFIVCALTWGINTVITNYGQKDMDSYQFIFFCYLFTAILTIPFISIENFVIAELDIRFYINFLIVSIGAMSFGTSVYMYATPKLGPIKASVFIFSVPFIALITAYIFLREPIALNVIVGGLLSLIAIYLVNRK